MTKIAAHARIPPFPHALSLQGAQLDTVREETSARHHDLVLDYHELCPITPPQLLKRNGKLYERVEGSFIPRRLRFVSIEGFGMSGVYETLDELPFDHPAREIRDMLRWIQAGHKLTFYLLDGNSPEPGDIRFYAQRVLEEDQSGEAMPVSLERDWSSAPPLPVGIVPFTKKLYERFGGDPVTIHLNDHAYHRRLFIGSLDIQSSVHPSIDSVLNLGEEPSKWVNDSKLEEGDRWVNKGEGSDGMSVDEIRQEAGWLIERINAGERVLVHCVAGMNRSATVCCAVLILLEGLSAEQALERVREHHPWARPDANHWLKLRWLAKNR